MSTKSMFQTTKSMQNLNKKLVLLTFLEKKYADMSKYRISGLLYSQKKKFHWVRELFKVNQNNIPDYK